MLVHIHARMNESIVINDDITIVVVEIRGDKVRLGVEAPKEVRGPSARGLPMPFIAASRPAASRVRRLPARPTRPTRPSPKAMPSARSECAR